MATKTAVRSKSRPYIAPTANEHMLRGNYPRTWTEFVGQDRAKIQLKVAAKSAKMRRVAFPHTLLADGAQGIGKTSLALLVAQEMGAHVKVATGKIKAAEARLLLAGMQNGDVLIIDEIHQLVQTSKRDAEWLLHYLQDGVLVGPLGPEEVPRVTIIGCTTDAGRLQETLLDRFRLKPPLDRYNELQAAQIAASLSKRILLDPLRQPSRENFRQIAVAGNNNPRVMGQLLETLRDIALTGGAEFRSRGYDLTDLFSWYGITEDGLNQLAQRYLVTLLEEFNGEPAGATAIQDRLQEPGGVGPVERLLQEKGFIKKIKQGRCLTQLGVRRSRELGALI